MSKDCDYALEILGFYVKHPVSLNLSSSIKAFFKPCYNCKTLRE